MEWPMPPTSGDVRQPMFSSLFHLAGSKLDRLDDVLITGASAQVSGDSPAYFFLAGMGILLEQRVGRHQHARRAVAALQSMLFFEALLQRMKGSVLHQAFDGEQFTAIGLHRKHGARFDCLSVEHNSAGTTMTGVATYMCACESRNTSDEVDEQHSGFNRGLPKTAVHFDFDQLFFGHLRILRRPSEWSFAGTLVCAPKRAPGQFLHQSPFVLFGPAQIGAGLRFLRSKLCCLRYV